MYGEMQDDIILQNKKHLAVKLSRRENRTRKWGRQVFLILTYRANIRYYM